MKPKTIQALISELQYFRRMQMIGGLAVCIIGLGGFLLAKWYYHHELSNFVQGVCLIVLLFGLYALVHAWRLLSEHRHDLIGMIRDRPFDVVWIYTYVSVNMPYGVRLFRLATIYVNDRHGNTESIMLRSSRLQHITRLLTNDFTRATFGYSVQKEQLFRANPELLYKD